jgi:hypothetical protein
LQSSTKADCAANTRNWRHWRVTDVAAVAQLIERGEQFDLILLGGSTCAQVNLLDLALLAAAVPHTPVLVAAECDNPERARAIK